VAESLYLIRLSINEEEEHKSREKVVALCAFHQILHIYLISDELKLMIAQTQFIIQSYVIVFS